MRKAFWFGCMGIVMAAGIVYLAASQAQKPQARTLGSQAAAPASHSNRLRELACCPETVSGITCVHAEEVTAPPAMPPQIIDVCQERYQHWTLGGAIHHYPELIPASLEVETVCTEEAEEIGMPQEETIEELGMPQEEPCEELGMPMEIDEDFCPMPCIINEEESVEPTACEQGDDPFVSFWLSLFKDVMPGADDEEPCEPASDEDACEEDPHHPEYYPHCPYMGGCRGVSPSCPASASPRTRTPHDEECEPCPKAEPDAESPAQPGIDTMEFRPEEDAKEGEFESKPM